MAINYQPTATPKFRFEWIGESWRFFQAQAGTWIVTFLIIFIVSAIVRAMFAAMLGLSMNPYGSSYTLGHPYGGFNYYETYMSPGQDVVGLIGVVINSFFLCGTYKMANEQVRGREINPGMLFQNLSVFVNMLGYNLLFSIAVFIGILLCIVPGLIAAALLLPGFALVADGVPVGEAISRSVNTAKNDIGGGILFMLAFGVLMILSALPCLLGLFVTVPMSWIIVALMYRDMIGMPAGVDSTTPYPTYQPGVWPPAPGSSNTPPPPPVVNPGSSVYPTYPATATAPEPPVAPPASEPLSATEYRTESESEIVEPPATAPVEPEPPATDGEPGPGGTSETRI